MLILISQDKDDEEADEKTRKIGKEK